MKTDTALLPNFLIIGAAKSGTTALYHLLAQHPEIFTPYKKELFFFNNDENYTKGTAWYIDNYFKEAGEYVCRGEATPGYLFWSEKVVRRILETYPVDPPKFIAIFRDPAARAYSAYWHLVHYGGENLSFEEALAAEDQRMQDYGAELNASGFIKYAYFRGGCYASQLRPYLETFPREQFLFLKSEDLSQHPVETLKQVTQFLGVSPIDDTIGLTPQERNTSGRMKSMKFYRWIRRRSSLKEFLKRFISPEKRFQFKQSLENLNMIPEKYPPMNPSTAKLLHEKFQDEIQLLADMTELDLSGWMNNV